jgi:enamine deaminase RidA (YjgF/YER057c/UK114 family)
MAAPLPIARLETSARFSEAVVHGGTVYLAGQVPADEALAGGAAAQMQSILAQVDAWLARAGSRKDRLLSATVYLTSFESYAEMNEAWVAWLPEGCAPARATVGNVTLANPKWLIEVSIIAAVA